MVLEDVGEEEMDMARALMMVVGNRVCLKTTEEKNSVAEGGYVDRADYPILR
jgi:hypothetical protein